MRDKAMIKVGIIGATGYAGQELVRLLKGHGNAEIKWYGSRSYIDKKYAQVYQNMFQIVEETCLDDNMEELAEQVDVIFTATPQGLCASMVKEEILSKVKIIVRQSSLCRLPSLLQRPAAWMTESTPASSR